MMLTNEADKSINLNLFTSVYEGPSNLFKVTKLQESSVYLFRVCATNETGQGEWSDICKVTTAKSPPIINKAPNIHELTSNSCQIEWTPAKFYSSSNNAVQEALSETLEYILQVQKSPNEKNSEYKEVYRGDSCSFKLKDLSANTEYHTRVCSVRVLSDLQRIYSPASPHTTFTTLKNPKNANNAKHTDSNNITSNHYHSSDSENNHNKNNSSSHRAESHLLSRFMWPSFYMKLNGDSSVSSSKKAVSSSSLSSSRADTNERISDKQWALLLIFVLVIIAFFTAFTFNTVYTSFNDEVSASNN